MWTTKYMVFGPLESVFFDFAIIPLICDQKSYDY